MKDTDIESLINDFTTEAVKPRSKKSRVKNRGNNEKINYKSKNTKDPVIAWLESESDIEEVYLDDNGFIASVKSHEMNTVHDVESIMKAIPNSVNKKGVDTIEDWLNEDSVIDTELA